MCTKKVAGTQVAVEERRVALGGARAVAVAVANEALRALGHAYRLEPRDGPGRAAAVLGHLAHWREVEEAREDAERVELYDAALDALCRLWLLLRAEAEGELTSGAGGTGP